MKPKSDVRQRTKPSRMAYLLCVRFDYYGHHAEASPGTAMMLIYCWKAARNYLQDPTEEGSGSVESLVAISIA